jgi:carbamoyl-phosphate synthase large subunit
VLIPGAGTGPGNSLIRSLRAGAPSLFIVGCHDDRFVLKRSWADTNYLVPPVWGPRFGDALRRIIDAERVDLIFPNTDVDVKAFSDIRDQLPGRLFLPSKAVIEICQDKHALTGFLGSRGFPVPACYEVTNLDDLEGIFDRLGSPPPFWCRIRSGTASWGAAPVRTPEQARGWIKYWEEMRGITEGSFTISEYLPGRDLGCQCLWKDGRLVLIKTVERLSYFGGADRPSGVSSNAALAKTVVEPAVARLCEEAIRALDKEASGAFTLDLKGDRAGKMCLTEINVGRFITTTNLFDLAGKHNMSATYVRLAMGDEVAIEEPYDAPEDYYFVRDLDMLPAVLRADEFFEGILDAR